MGLEPFPELQQTQPHPLLPPMLIIPSWLNLGQPDSTKFGILKRALQPLPNRNKALWHFTQPFINILPCR
jgi:hypothetical protein